MDNPTKYAVGILGYIFQNLVANTFFNKLITQGFNATQSIELYNLNWNEIREVIDTFYINATSKLYLPKLNYFYPEIGGTAPTHAINSTDPNNNIIDWINGPTHGADGVKMNGTTQYGKTGIIASTDLILNNFALSIYTQVEVDESVRDMGAQNSGTQRILWDSNRADSKILFDSYNGTTSRLEGGVSGNGHIMVSRRTAIDVEGYRNGVSIVSDIGGGGSEPTFEIYLGSLNNAGAPSSFSSKEYSAFSIGEGMTDAEISDFYTDLQELQTNLGRSV